MRNVAVAYKVLTTTLKEYLCLINRLHCISFRIVKSKGKCKKSDMYHRIPTKQIKETGNFYRRARWEGSLSLALYTHLYILSNL